MNKREILAIASKIIGIYYLVFSIHLLQSVILALSLIGKAGGSIYAFGTLVTFILLLVSSYFLLTKADDVATALSKESGNNSQQPNSLLEKNVILEISFTIMGVYILVNSLPGIIKILWQIGKPISYGSGASLITTIIEFVIKILIGVFLILYPVSLVRLIDKIKGKVG